MSESVRKSLKMPLKLKISDFVLKRIKNVKNEGSGGLFGVMYQGNLLILGFSLESPSKENPNCKRMQENFPTEVDLCGLITFGSSVSAAKTHLKKIFHDVDITDNPIHLAVDSGVVKASLFVHEQLQEIDYEVLSAEDIYKEFFYLRLQCDLEVLCQETERSIKDEMLNLRKRIASGISCFTFPGTEVFLGAMNLYGMGEESKSVDLLHAVSKSTGEAKRKTAAPVDFDVLTVNLLLKQSRNENDEAFNRATIGVVLTDHTTETVRIPIRVDSLSLIYGNTRAINIYEILVESLCRILRLAEKNLLMQLKNISVVKELSAPSTFHFKPDNFGHFFTCIYPARVSDDDSYLTSRRKNFHNYFGLPTTRPFFRRGNAHFRDAHPSNPRILINPHIGARGAPLPGGRQHLVQGRYAYHHYTQDAIDDSGWGCAYRSLQTLCSWFRLQGYTDAAVPSHRDIQRHLVDVGDKPAAFIGSAQWIGSMEVSMCLNHFVGVDSRILHVASGGELASKGAELAHHFDTQGTPIMIGGGVLAHTILGVDLNAETGECRFLILDPHYTGADELATVQAKGWCGWKAADFWDKKSYNLCMPQRPQLF